MATETVQEVFSVTKRQRLREARERLQIKLERLAGESGYALSTISSVENGHHNPSERFVKRIADVLGVNVEWIETGKGEMINASRPPTRLWVPLIDQYAEHMEATARMLRDHAAEMNAEADELDRHARGYEELRRHRAAQARAQPATQESVTEDNGLTYAETSITSVAVKAQLPNLLEEVKEATAEPGKKTALAEFLSKVTGRAVPLASVSRWLSGEREPGGEIVLQMQAWLKRPNQ